MSMKNGGDEGGMLWADASAHADCRESEPRANPRISRGERGVSRTYMEKMTGLSTSQMTRLIRAYLDTGRVHEKPYRRREFPVRYTDVDIALLAEPEARPPVKTASRHRRIPRGGLA